VPIAVGFADDFLWVVHFIKHRHEFGAETKEDYLVMAKAFIEADLATNRDIQECTNSDEIIIRFNRRTDEFAMVTATGTIITYFRPTPRRKAPESKKTHRFRTNLEYFKSECRK